MGTYTVTVRAYVTQFTDYTKTNTQTFTADSVVTLTVNRFSESAAGCMDTVFDPIQVENMNSSVHSGSALYFQLMQV